VASVGPIQVMTRIGTPGAPPALLPGQLAYNQPNFQNETTPADVLYIGDGQTVIELVGAGRQVELWGNQTITGEKTIDVTDLKLTGGEADWLLTTDGDGNISWTNAPGGGLTQVATDGVTLTGDGTPTSPLAVVPDTVAVATDGVTITGNGTTASPLAAHSVAVATDGVTLSGNGLTATPLAVVAHSVAIATTGASLTGNGTTASPLAVAPNTVPVATNTTLSGNGTTASPLAVVPGSLAVSTNNTLSGNGTTSSPLGVVADTVAVAADGVTITGNGTTASPLTAMNGTVAVAVDGVTLSGTGTTGSPLHVLPDSVTVATNTTLIGQGTTAAPLGLNGPVSLQNGGTGVSTTSNAALLTALGAAPASSLANYVPLAGGTMTGLLVLSGNASASLDAVPLQQLNSAISAAPFLPLSGGTLTGPLSGTTVTLSGTGTVLTLSAGNASIGGTLAVAGATTLNGNTTLGGSATLTLSGNATTNLEAVPLQQLNAAIAGVVSGAVVSNTVPSSPTTGELWFNTGDAQTYVWNGATWVVAVNPPVPPSLPLAGGTVTGNLTVTGSTNLASPTTIAGLTATGTASLPTTTIAGLTVTGATNLASPTNIAGVTNGAAAPAGDIGEFMRTTTPLVSTIPNAGSGTIVASLLLTAGVWLVWGGVYMTNTPGSALNNVQVWPQLGSTVANPTYGDGWAYSVSNPQWSQSNILTGPVLWTLTAAQTGNLVAFCSANPAAASTIQAVNFNALRIR
jgi:trimeric autotransporter adhesin